MGKPRNGIAKEDMAKVLIGLVDNEMHDDPGQEAYPCLFRLLTSIARDGKLVQQEGTLVLVKDGPLWRVTITQPTYQKTVQITCPSLCEILQHVEDLIAGGKLVWKDSWKKSKKDRQELARRLQ